MNSEQSSEALGEVSPTEIKGLAKELERLARSQSSARFETDDAVRISELTRKAGLGTRQELVDLAIARLPEVPAEIATILVGTHDDRYIHPLGRRRERAAERFGFSSETFRKRYRQKPSHYQKLLISVAKAMFGVAQELSESTEVQIESETIDGQEALPLPTPAVTAEASLEGEGREESGANTAATSAEDSDDLTVGNAEDSAEVMQDGGSEPKSTSRFSLLALVSLIVLVGGLLAGNVWRRARLIDDAAATPVAKAGVGALSAPSSGVSIIASTEPVEGCDFPVGVRVGGSAIPAIITEKAQEAYSLTVGQGRDVGCPKHVMHEWQDFWVQETLSTNTVSAGVIVAHDDMEQALWIEDSLWVGYKRQMSGEMYNIEGVPTKFEMYGQYPRLVLASGAELISLQEGGSAKYIPSNILSEWGGIDGPLGVPFTDIHYSQGYLRLEFAYGHMIMESDDNIIVRIASEEEIETEREAIADVELPGIARTFDGTAWYVDTDGIRHWIPDVDEWFCAGGDDAVVIADTPAWALTDYFPIGEVAKCSDFD